MSSSKKKIKTSLKSAKECITNNDYEEAQKHVKSVLRLDPANYNALVFAGLCLTRQHALDKAEHAYKQAVNESQDTPTAWQGLEEVYLQTENKDELIIVYQKLRELIKTPIDKWREFTQKLINIYIERSKFSECYELAKELYDTIDRSNDETSLIYKYIAQLADFAEKVELKKIQNEFDEEYNKLRYKRYNEYQKEQQKKKKKSKAQGGKSIGDANESETSSYSDSSDGQMVSMDSLVSQEEKDNLEQSIRDEILLNSNIDEYYKQIIDLNVFHDISYHNKYIKRLFRRFTLKGTKENAKKQKEEIIIECRNALKLHPNASYPIRTLLYFHDEDNINIKDMIGISINTLRNRLCHGFPSQRYSMIQLGILLYQNTGIQWDANQSIGFNYNYFQSAAAAAATENTDSSLKNDATDNNKLDTSTAFGGSSIGITSGSKATQKQLNHVSDVLTRGLNEHPSCVEGQEYVGKTWFYLNKFKSALRCALKGVEVIDSRIDNEFAEFDQKQLFFLTLQARSLYSLYQKDDALVIFQKLLQLDEYNMAALQGVGQIYFDKKRYKESAEYFHRIITHVDPRSSLAHAQIGWIDYLIGEHPPERALQSLQRAIELEPSQAVYHHRIGRIYWELGGEYRTDKKYAYHHFIQSAKLDPQFASNFTFLGHFYRDVENDINKSKRCYLKAINLNPLDEPAGESLSSIYLSSGQVSLAVDLYQNVSKKSSRAKWAWKHLGFYQLQEKEDYGEAFICFQRALRVDDKDAECWEGLAVSYHMQGKYVAALRGYRKVLDIDKSSVYSLYQFGCIKHTLGDNEEAKPIFEHVIKKQPDYFVAYKVLAETLFGIAQDKHADTVYESAMLYIRKALAVLDLCLKQENAESFSSIWKLRGDILTFTATFPERVFSLSYDALEFNVNETKLYRENLPDLPHKTMALQEGAKSFKQVVDLDPHDAMAFYDLGVNIFYQSVHNAEAKEDRNERDRLLRHALTQFRKAIQLSPKESLFWNALGCVAKSPKLKQHAFIKGIYCNQKSVTIWNNLGFMYLENREFGLAQQAFLTSTKINPSSGPAWIGLALLNESIRNNEGLAGAKSNFEHAASLSAIPPATSGFGYTAFVSGEYLSAIQALLKHNQSDASKPALWNALGLCYESISKYRESVYSFSTSLEILEKTQNETSRTPTTTYNNTGFRYSQQDIMPTLCFSDSEYKVPIEHQIIFVKQNLARSLCRLGEFDRAQKLYEECIASDLLKEDITTMRGLAEVHGLKSDYATCIEYLMKSKSLAEKTGFHDEIHDIMLAIAKVYFHANKFDDSRKQTEECIRTFKDSTIARHIYSALCYLTFDETQAKQKSMNIIVKTHHDTFSTNINTYVAEYHLQMASGEVEKATRTLTKMIHMFPDRQTLWDDLAETTVSAMTPDGLVEHALVHPGHMSLLYSQLAHNDISSIATSLSHDRDALIRRMLSMAYLLYAMGVAPYYYSHKDAVKNALYLAQRIVRHDPTQTKAWYLIAASQHSLAQTTMRKSDLESAVNMSQYYLSLGSEHGKHLGLQIALCEDLIALRRYDECMKHVRKLLNHEFPNDPVLFGVLGKCMRARGKDTDLEKYFKLYHKALEIDVNCIYVWHELADVYRARGEYAAVIRCLELCADVVEHQYAHIDLSSISEELQSGKKSKKKKKKKKRNNNEPMTSVPHPALFVVYARLAIEHLRIKDNKEAAAYASKALLLNRESSVGHFVHGTALSQSSKTLEEGVNALNAALIFDRSIPLANVSLYNAMRKAKNPNDAKFALDQEETQQPISKATTKVFQLQAQFYLEQNELSEAERYIQHAIHLDPSDQDGWDLLEKLRSGGGKTEGNDKKKSSKKKKKKKN